MTAPRAPEFAVEEACVLLAESDATTRDQLTRLLERRWAVEAVTSGEEALAAARRRRPDLLLAGTLGGAMDARDLIRTLRREPSTAQVVAITLLPRDRNGDLAREAGDDPDGADDYIVAPFGARELMARVATQLELTRLRRTAGAERARLLALFTQAPIAIGAFEGPEHTIVLANAEWERVAGRRIALGVPLVQALPELAGQPVLEVHDRVYQRGIGETVTEFPLRIGPGPDNQKYFTMLFEPLRDADGVMIGYMAIGFDVTGHVHARRQVDEQSRLLVAANDAAQQARAAAEAASRTKDEFLAMLGHELRNPLAPIVTALQLMRLRGGDGGAFLRERQVIERQVGHLTRLVDDLLDVSRIARGKIELHRRPVEIATVVAQAIELASPLLELRRHQLVVNVPASDLCVSGDEHRLSQVVANLLTNAAKYTDYGGRIEIKAWQEEEKAVLSVRDNGAGIPSELLPRVFDFFVQGQRSRARSEGGLGLGLTIVRNVVELHGGTVHAHSSGQGQGSEFVVRLPLLVRALAARSRAARHAAPGRAGADRVLVVDDNADAADLIAEGLGTLGFEVRVAHDALSALDVAREFEPEVGVLDIGLPVIDGYDLAQRLRALLGSRLVLIAVTGYGQSNDRERSRMAGFADHLVKPVEVRELAERIQAVAHP
jgi:signal transduction histidine kinase